MYFLMVINIIMSTFRIIIWACLIALLLAVPPVCGDY